MKLFKLIQPHLVRHWFKLCVVGFLVFLFLQKELSFRLQLSAPVRQEQAPLPLPEPVEKEQKTVLTDQTDPAKVVTDRLQLFGGGEESTKQSAMDKLVSLDASIIQAFIKRFAHVAETEQDKYGIPASITLASSLLHSQAGMRDLTRQAHNYFSITCSDDWTGQRQEINGKCYRVYNNAWTSFRDHSLFVTTGALAYMKQFNAQDYRSWARELEKVGFSKEEGLAKQLLGVIERYELQRFD